MRLFSVNEALTTKHTAAPRIIAADLSCPLDAVYIGNRASGPAVFYENRQSSEGTRCAFNLKGSYWQQSEAKAAVAVLLARLSIDPGRRAA